MHIRGKIPLPGTPVLQGAGGWPFQVTPRDVANTRIDGRIRETEQLTSWEASKDVAAVYGSNGIDESVVVPDILRTGRLTIA